MSRDPEQVGSSGYTDAMIADMPLHAITQELGHEGLVRRFRMETRGFSSGEQVPLAKAFEWAMDLHAKDTRYREPATNHLLRVPIRIMHHYGVKDLNLTIAGLLHDSIEDHKYAITGKRDATKEEAQAVLEREFNADAAALVGAVTNPDYEGSMDRLDQYQAHVIDILENDQPRVRILKVSDFTDNAKSLIYMPEEGAAYRARRYAVLVPAFEKAIMDSTTPLSPDARALILEDLGIIQHRLDTILR